MESLNSNFQEKELQQLQQMQDKAKESCMVSFRLLHSHLKALSNNDLKGTCIEGGFERAFATLFNQDFQSFTGSVERRVYDRMMLSKKRKDNSSKAFDVGLVVTESNETESERHVLSSRSRNDTHTDDADINSVNDKQSMAKHSEQFESVYDTYLLEKVDRNTTPESTDMGHRGGEIDQNADAKKC
nr:hypothetical protein [Tanacetum cinerariifolium]